MLDELRAQGAGEKSITAPGALAEAELEPLFTALVCRQPDVALQSALCCV